MGVDHSLSWTIRIPFLSQNNGTMLLLCHSEIGVLVDIQVGSTGSAVLTFADKLSGSSRHSSPKHTYHMVHNNCFRYVWINIGGCWQQRCSCFIYRDYRVDNREGILSLGNNYKWEWCPYPRKRLHFSREHFESLPLGLHFPFYLETLRDIADSPIVLCCW